MESQTDSRARTKIVATVGPACADRARLRALIEAGADVFRINMAHGTRQEHQQLVAEIRGASEQTGTPVAILVDLAGPKIRLQQLPAPLDCKVGDRLVFVDGEPQAANELTSTYSKLVQELQVGDPVLLADGNVVLRVIHRDAGRAECEVRSAGQLNSRQGINLPGVILSTPSLTPVDRENLAWAAQQGVDFVSLSFVRQPEDMQEVKRLLREQQSTAMTVAKIEKREALDQIHEVVAASDAVMVARGDLGVEIDVAETPAAQKRVIRICQELKKPVIVATQMLDSMQRSRRPTRAEATDVANAVLDGADACMLSAETAVGRYPTESVAMMNRIMLSAESLLLEAPPAGPVDDTVHPITSAVVRGAALIAEQVRAKMVVIYTRSGATARIKAKLRDLTPTLGVSQQAGTLRQMSLFWGITPVAAPQQPTMDGPALRQFIDRWGLADGSVVEGDRLVFVTGSNLVEQAHNTIAVHEVEAVDPLDR